MYKYSLYPNEDERNLLQAPEGVLDVDSRPPSALTGDQLTLSGQQLPSDVLRPSALTGQRLMLGDMDPEPLPESEDLGAAPAPAAAAPVGEGVGSYAQDAAKEKAAQQAEEEMYAPGYPMKDVMAHIKRSGELADQIVTEGGGTTPSKLVSAAPDWYKGGPPPGTNSWGELAGVLGNAITAAPAQRLKDPNRRASLKQRDAQQVALGSGLSTLFSHLFNKGQENYDRNQAAALKEAQMMRTLAGTKTKAQLESDANDKYIDQAQRARGQADLQKKRAFDQQQILEQTSQTSERTMALRNYLARNNIKSMQETEGMNEQQLIKMTGLTNTQLAAELGAGQKAVDANQREREIILAKVLDADKQLQTQIAEEQQRRGESAIPEMFWRNNTPPSRTAVDDTRELYGSKKGFIDRLDRMRALQTRIVELANKYADAHHLPRGSAEVLSMLGPINRWTETLGPEAHDIANEAAVLQTSIQNFIRSKAYSNLGVMQQWEDLKTRLMVPVANDPTAFFRGEATWKALRNDVERMWVDGVHRAGGFLEGEPDPGAAPGAMTPEQRAAARPRPTIPTAQKYNPRTRQAEDIEAPTPEAAPGVEQLPTQQAPTPTPPPGPPTGEALKPGNKWYLLTINGVTQRQQMTPGAAKVLGKNHKIEETQ